MAGEHKLKVSNSIQFEDGGDNGEDGDAAAPHVSVRVVSAEKVVVVVNCSMTGRNYGEAGNGAGTGGPQRQTTRELRRRECFEDRHGY